MIENISFNGIKRRFCHDPGARSYASIALRYDIIAVRDREPLAAIFVDAATANFKRRRLAARNL
jgi:hypothetical protein